MVRLAALLFAFPIGLAGIILLIGRNRIGLVLLSAALLSAAIHFVPRGVRAVRRLIENQRVRRLPQPTNPPIEQIAADLRRLLREHDASYGRRAARRAVGACRIGSRDHRSCAAGGACARCAAPCPVGRTAGLSRQQLCKLLRALATEGLVLPTAVGLLAPDGRY